MAFGVYLCVIVMHTVGQEQYRTENSFAPHVLSVEWKNLLDIGQPCCIYFHIIKQNGRGSAVSCLRPETTCGCPASGSL